MRLHKQAVIFLMSIGMNLSAVNYWSMEDPFIDRFKTAGSFYYRGPTGRGDIDPSVLDSNGWPVSQPADTMYGFSVPLDPADTGETHHFVLTYSGTGSFNFAGAHNVTVNGNRIEFDADPALLVEFSMSNSDPVHDIHIVRADQEAAFNAGALFTPEFLEKTSNWSVLRFMDWNETNHSDITSWDQRGQVSDARWSNVPIEVEVALANQAHSDMWVNIPAEANDDYVRQLATYVRDHLDPSLKLHLEYSNEVWNQSFGQATYAQQQADALWGNGSSVYFGNEVYYGYRAAQVMTIAKQVFGNEADQRFSGVLATFTGYTGVESTIFDGVSRAGLGAASSMFKEYAVTTYFGDQFGAFGYDADQANDKAKILGWAESGEAGMAAAFNELLHGGALAQDYSLDNWRHIWNYQGQVAATNGLSMVAYEGGFSSSWFTWPSDKQAEVVDFMKRLLADPRMGDLYTTMAQYFTAAGGTELTAFSDVGSTTIWGAWGATESIYDTSPRYEALAALSGRGTTTSGTTSMPTVTPAPVVADPTHTSLSNVTMDAGATTLTYTGSADFTATGNALANTITGGDHGNHLDGLDGNDTLTGGAGNDALDGGTGADRMVGGAGDDIYIVDNIGDVVVENANEGADEVRTTLAAYALPDNVENLTFTGTGDFHGTGNALANILTGGAGNDVLDGGAGADRLIGGAGNDVYMVDNVGDVVVENANEGTDEVRTTLTTYALPDNVENLTFTGTGDFHGTGNALANVLTGGAGNDVLDGGAGNDVLNGGAGADRLIGGAGNDVYLVDNVGDVVVENANEGTDEVRTTLTTYALPDNVENLTFIGTGAFTGTGNGLDNVLRAGDGGSRLSGGAGNDTLYGGAGADYLDGGAGADMMVGGAGGDTYVVDNVGDSVVEQPGGGTDTVLTSLALYTLGANVENLTYTGNAAFTGTGNELDNVITGAALAANKLYGGDGNDTLYGGSGNDYLDGGNGTDTMVGGAGNDVYIVRDSSDVVVEQANGGLDEVRSYAASYTLAANVEVLTFVGTGDFTGTGNGDDNVITGGAGNDHLYGGAGNDTLIGGAGNDWLDGGTGADRLIGGVGDDAYIVDNVNDRVLENVGEGYDTIYASVSYTLPANVERLILTGTANLNATGNSAANTLTGNAGNNILDGGAGNDTLIGGAGADTLTGGSGADTFVFSPGDLLAPGQTTDRITDFSHAEGDKIDLRAFGIAQGSPLSFIGAAAFNHHAGQGEVRLAAAGSNWDVAIDLNGDGVADLHLTVTSPSGMLVNGDFFL